MLEAFNWTDPNAIGDLQKMLARNKPFPTSPISKLGSKQKQRDPKNK